MNDGIPLHVSHFIRDDTPSVVGQPDFEQRNETREPSATPSSGSADIETWAPESPYDIPGELVLAKEKRSNTQYWPAKLMRYFPPSKRGAKARYEVLFYDGKVMRLPDDSDMFFNEVHPNFKNCRVRAGLILIIPGLILLHSWARMNTTMASTKARKTSRQT